MGPEVKNGVQSVEDSPRPGQAHRAITPEMIAAVDDLIWENCLITISETAMEMKIRCCTWTSLQIGWRGNGGGAWVAGTATRRLLLLRNLCLCGTLKEVCRMWWRLHWRLVSLYCMCFYNKSLYMIFPVFIWMTFVCVVYIYFFQVVFKYKALNNYPARQERYICEPLV
jgi:hypothetical protein